MLVLIGILIVFVIIIVLYYNDLISEKVKVEDAQDALKTQLEKAFKPNADNLDTAINSWQKEGLSLDETSKKCFDNLYIVINAYNAKLKRFPFSLMAEIFKMKAISIEE